MSDWKFTPAADFEKLIAEKLRPYVAHVADVIAKEAADTAPKLTGRLAKSVYVNLSDHGMTAEIGFTDSKAAAAHEEMHDHYDAGKRPKFLELALHQHADEMLDAGRQALRAVFR